MQPASGARDLNPQQVEVNQLLTNKLSNIFKLWAYEEVSPPNIERLATLMAGGAIQNKDILKVVSDESLGLRPEMTASISRAASTRLANKTRPLRLWAKGTVFKSKEATEGKKYIEESQECGIELFGIRSIAAEIELFSLLLDSYKSLNLNTTLKPTILIGHTKLIELILHDYDIEIREQIKLILTNYNLIEINNLNISDHLKEKLTDIINCRGIPSQVINKLENIYGKVSIIDELRSLFEIIEPISNDYNVIMQLDPTYSPHFDLYNGFMFQMICKVPNNNVIIAKGGRYDGIVRIFSKDKDNATGVGFSFSVDKIRELTYDIPLNAIDKEKILIAYTNSVSITEVLKKQRELHEKGKTAIVEIDSCQNKSKAFELLEIRNCNKLEWLT